MTYRKVVGMQHHRSEMVEYVQRRIPLLLLASLLACSSLTGCSAGRAGTDDNKEPSSAAGLPEYLCDSGVSTDPLREMYPKGTSGPVQMIRGNDDTGNIHHFMDKEAKGGNSAWGCWVQFDGEKAEESAFRASIVAISAGNSTSLESLGRTAGYQARTLSLGVIHGVNGPQHSILDFPCQTKEHKMATMRVIMLHPIDEYAADAKRERMVRLSVKYMRDLSRYVVETLHLCKNLRVWPTGKFSSKPILDGSPKPSRDDG